MPLSGLGLRDKSSVARGRSQGDVPADWARHATGYKRPFAGERLGIPRRVKMQEFFECV